MHFVTTAILTAILAGSVIASPAIAQLRRGPHGCDCALKASCQENCGAFNDAAGQGGGYCFQNCEDSAGCAGLKCFCCVDGTTSPGKTYETACANHGGYIDCSLQVLPGMQCFVDGLNCACCADRTWQPGTSKLSDDADRNALAAACAKNGGLNTKVGSGFCDLKGAKGPGVKQEALNFLALIPIAPISS